MGTVARPAGSSQYGPAHVRSAARRAASGRPAARAAPRRPFAVAALVCGLLVLALGAAGLVMLTGHPGCRWPAGPGVRPGAVRIRRPGPGPLAGRRRPPRRCP